MQITSNAADAFDSSREGVESLIRWFAVNREDLPLGLAVGAAIVGLMFAVRLAGGWMLAGDPHCTRWRGIIGRVLSRTTVFFMVACALDILATYTDVPGRIARLVDILFIVAVAVQVAIWARELIIGAISRRVGEDPGERRSASRRHCPSVGRYRALAWASSNPGNLGPRYWLIAGWGLGIVSASGKIFKPTVLEL